MNNYYLLFDRVKIQGANAISSPLTYGFPAITGFLGAIHALNRKIENAIRFNGVLIACHHYELQVHQNSPYSDRTFNQTRNPLLKNGENAPIMEEGKIDLEVSLVVSLEVEDERLEEYHDIKNTLGRKWLSKIQQQLWQQRIAGGSVISIERVQLFKGNQQDDIKALLIPAFVLMDASESLIDITQQLQQGIDDEGREIIKANPNATALDALIEVATLHYLPTKNVQEKHTDWQIYSLKQGYGWLVPIPVGYQGISDRFAAGVLQHCRTNDYPSQYVETLYSLGKWVFPLNLPENLDECFWHYNAVKDDLYLVSQGA